ncbi:hypothetical protein CASFOL_036077 [Castilleja foliolosa]|uniref:Cyclin-dependent kinase inhibitor domain-containing protein n=1 Tax=Castilleja foliolosa TaxID=1961234 RepID=A0ABD3BUJ5_9LAMI
MEEYLKCESHLTTTTWRSVEENMEMISGKKRKFDSELRNEDYRGCDVEVVTENPVSPATSRTSGGSDKYEEHSNDVVKRGLSDLETEVFETGIPTSIDRIFSRECTPTSELYGDSEEILLQSLSTPKKKSLSPPENPRRKIVEITPSAAELDEFFAAAEEYDRKRFVEKYNFDIVKDVPLEGKYQWVRLQD